MAAALFTIGYEGRVPDELIAAVTAAGVRTVVDVRQLALSHKRGMSKTGLASALAAAGVGYRNLRALSNPRDNRAGLRAGTDEARERYRRVLATPEGEAALHEIAELLAAGPVALLCMERDPANCHRRLVAEALGRAATDL